MSEPFGPASRSGPIRVPSESSGSFETLASSRGGLRSVRSRRRVVGNAGGPAGRSSSRPTASVVRRRLPRYPSGPPRVLLGDVRLSSRLGTFEPQPLPSLPLRSFPRVGCSRCPPEMIFSRRRLHDETTKHAMVLTVDTVGVTLKRTIGNLPGQFVRTSSTWSMTYP